jgi:hypothetical protein
MSTLWQNLLRRLSRSTTGSLRRGQASPTLRRHRPQLEHLEQRLAPTVTVTRNYPGLSYANTTQAPAADASAPADPSLTRDVEVVSREIELNPGSSSTSSTPPVFDTLSHFFFKTGGRKDLGGGSDSPFAFFTHNLVYDKDVVGEINHGSSNGTVTNQLVLAVSITNKPATLTTADWKFYTLFSTSKFDPEDVSIGQNNSAVVITMNMYDAGTTTLDHVEVITISQAELTKANPTLTTTGTSPTVFFNKIATFTDGTTATFLRPTAINDDHVTTVASDPIWFVQEGANPSIEVVKMTNLLSTALTITATNLKVNAYKDISSANNDFPQQPGTPATVGLLGSPIQNVAEANNTLVACQTIDASNASLNDIEDDVRWYQIDVSSGTPVLTQEGNISAGKNTYLYNPAIAITNTGDIGVGYVRSGTDTATDFPSVWVTGRTASDPVGTMETPVLVQSGLASYNDQGKTSTNRFGDFSKVTASETGFTIANEYATAASATAPNWGTVIANFTLEGGPNPSQSFVLNAQENPTPSNDSFRTTGTVFTNPNGAAGPASYVETMTANDSAAGTGYQTIGIFDLNGNLLTDKSGNNITDNLTHFYFTTGGLKQVDSTSALNLASVVFDDFTQQFIVGDLDFDGTTHKSKFDIAVSKTATPTTLTTADWNFYSIGIGENNGTASGTFNVVYPGNLGYNADALVVTFNANVPKGDSGTPHVEILSISQADLAGGVSQANLHFFENNFTGANQEENLRPTVMHDAVAGGPMWLVQEHGDDQSIDVVKMTNVLSTTPTFTTTNLAVNPYSAPNAPLNPNGSLASSGNDSRILKAAENNGTIVACQVVGVGTTEDDARWYEVDVSSGTPILQDQGNVSEGPNNYIQFPAIDINSQGAVGLSFAQSGRDSNTDFFGSLVTYRLATDPVGTMRTPQRVGQAGFYFLPAEITGDVAGGYSGINVDANGTFWVDQVFVQQAIGQTGSNNVFKLSVNIAHFSAPQPAVVVNNQFGGLDSGSTGGQAPAATRVAVGPSSTLETVDLTAKLFNKTTGAAIASDTLSDFFYTQGKLTQTDSTSTLGSPTVIYDQFTNRYIIGVLDADSSTDLSNYDLAVSTTSNPTTFTATSWKFYQLNTSQSSYNATSPGVGYNRDALVLALGMSVPAGGSGTAHMQIVAIKQSSLGGASLTVFQDTSGTPAVSGEETLVPTVMHDSKAGDPMWLIGEDANLASIDVIKMTNVLSTTPTFTTTNLPVNAYTDANASSLLQPDGTVVDGSIDSRVRNAAQANNTIVACQDVSNFSSTANLGTTATSSARWYAISVSTGAPTIAQQGDVNLRNNQYLFDSAIDINAQSDIGMTFVAAGTDQAADDLSMYVTGRAPADPANTMGLPALVQAGAANYHDNSGQNPLGGGIGVDSNGSFWVANVFTNTQPSPNWGTAVANFFVIPVVASTSGPRFGADVWTGANQAVDLNWSDPANWSLGRAPNAGDIVEFTNNPKVVQVNSVVDKPFTIAGLEIDGSWNGTLTVKANVTLENAVLNEWDSGIITTSAGVSLTNDGEMIVTNPSVITLSAGSLVNKGLFLQGNGAGLQLQNGSTLTNKGTYSIFADTGILNGSGTNTVVNTGVLEKFEGSGTSTIAATVNNTGTVAALSGTVQITGPVRQVAANTLTGGTWTAFNSGTLNITSGSFATIGKGTTVTLSGGKATFSNLSSLTTIAAGGAFNLLAGQSFSTTGGLTNSGLLTVDTGGVLTVNGAFTEKSTATLTSVAGGTPNNPSFGSIDSKGQVTLAGNLAITDPDLIPLLSAMFEIIDDQSGKAISGTFAGLAEGGTLKVTVGTVVMTFQATYKGGTGSDNFFLTRIS